MPQAVKRNRTDEDLTPPRVCVLEGKSLLSGYNVQLMALEHSKICI